MSAPSDPLASLDTVAVLVVAGQPLYREALIIALAGLDQPVEILAADSVAAALGAKPGRRALSMVLMDGNPPDMDGIRALALIAKRYPGVPALIVAASERPDDAKRALQAGAAGYVPKSAPTRTLIEAVKLVLGGGIYTPPLLAQARAVQGDDGSGITGRQREVLGKIGEGKSNKDIARDLGLSEKTVKAHISEIFKTLGVANRLQAVNEARRQGLIPSD